tara:strand:- start:10 stop:777 length:768 start_codon:yes stop_codon:yes gene_type:complete
VGQFKVTAAATDITAGNVGVTDTHNITFANSASIQEDEAKISFSINAENVNTFVRVLHFVKAKIGATGATGAAGSDAHTNDILDITFSPAAVYTANTAKSAWFKDSDGSDGANSAFFSQTEYDGRCFCSFVWDGTPAAAMKVGISSSVAPADPGGESLISIFYSGGAWRGRIIQTGTSVATFGTVAAGDRFSLRYDGTETTFFQNGNQIDASEQGGRFIKADGTVPLNVGGWMFTGSIITAGASAAQITDVIFLP